jgi:hypothetical protein
MNATQALTRAHRGEMFTAVREAANVAGVVASWPLSRLHCFIVQHHVTVVLPEDGKAICRRCYQERTL